MKNLIYRSQWGARKPNCVTKLNRGQVDGIAVHYTGADADEQSNHRNCAGRVRGIQRFHMDSRGWCDIAYNFVVCKHGYIYQGRGWYNRSAAQGTNDGNDRYLAVCFLGNDSVNRDDVTAAGRAAYKRVFARFRVWYKKKPDLRPHSSFTSTECPGDELRAWLRTL